MVAGGHGERLQYNGGPVQHEPKLYLLFWGSNWEKHKTLDTELRGLLYGNLEAENDIPGGTAAWQGIVSQYYSNTPGPYKSAKIAGELKQYNVAAPQNVEDANLQQQVSTWIGELYTKGTPPNANAQFIVLPAPGTTYKDETLIKEGKMVGCGYHATTQEVFGTNNEKYSYSLVAYGGDVVAGKEKCNYASGYGGGEEEQLDHSTSFVGSHEFAESVTDPLTSRTYSTPAEDPYKSAGNPNVPEIYGWTGQPKDDQTEIGDECASLGPFQLAGKRAWVTKLWDDEGGNKCSLEDPPYPAPTAPTATTGSATGITTCGATLTGTVGTKGPDTQYHFEYGPTTAYGSSTSERDAGFGEANVPVSVPVTVGSGATYHYRLVASSWAGTTDGEDHTFSTPFAPPVFSSQFGADGTGNGEFEKPTYAAADASGNVWVADSGSTHNRLQEFMSAGKFIRTFGSTGTGPGQFSKPLGIAINNTAGTMYVVDSYNGRVEEFSEPEGKYIREFGKSIGLALPEGVALDSSGDVWVVDKENTRLVKFSPTGEYIAAYGSRGSNPGEFKKPRGIAIDAQNHVYVADEGNSRIQEFSDEGKFIAAFGTAQSKAPYGIAIDSRSGNVFTTDEAASVVDVFTSTGSYLGQFGSGRFSFPEGIAIDSTGDVYVVSTEGGYVDKFIPGC